MLTTCIATGRVVTLGTFQGVSAQTDCAVEPASPEQALGTAGVAHDFLDGFFSGFAIQTPEGDLGVGLDGRNHLQEGVMPSRRRLPAANRLC